MTVIEARFIEPHSILKNQLIILTGIAVIRIVAVGVEAVRIQTSLGFSESRLWAGSFRACHISRD